MRHFQNEQASSLSPSSDPSRTPRNFRSAQEQSTEHQSQQQIRSDPCTPTPDLSLIPCFSSLKKVRAEEVVVFRKTIVLLNVGRLLVHDARCVRAAVVRTVKLGTRPYLAVHSVLQAARSAQKQPGPESHPPTPPRPPDSLSREAPPIRRCLVPSTPSYHTPVCDSPPSRSSHSTRRAPHPWWRAACWDCKREEAQTQTPYDAPAC